jgi:hypothetical protein
VRLTSNALQNTFESFIAANVKWWRSLINRQIKLSSSLHGRLQSRSCRGKCIKLAFEGGVQGGISHRNSVERHGCATISYSPVSDWRRAFRRRRQDIEDDARYGQIPDSGMTIRIQGALEQGLFVFDRTIAEAAGYATSIVFSRVVQTRHLKYRHW